MLTKCFTLALTKCFTRADQMFHSRALARFAVMARFDWVHFEYDTEIYVSVTPDSCQSALDLMFLLDASGSIEMPAYGGASGNFQNKVLGFVNEIVPYVAPPTVCKQRLCSTLFYFSYVSTIFSTRVSSLIFTLAFKFPNTAHDPRY
jgi:hypothetical protein